VSTGDVNTRRRYYLLLSRDEEALGNLGTAAGLRRMQQSEPGTTLPGSIAAALATKLAAAGYHAREDLDGADATELTERGLTSAEAATVLKALE
jgi:hypothetical protein